MKKWFAIFIICLLPFSVFAMDVIDDVAMENVTGAEGIDLFLAGTLEIQVSGHQLKYGDTDGLYSTGNGGFLVLDSPHDPPQDSTLSLTFTNAMFSIDVGTKDRVFDSPHADIIPMGTSFIRVEVPKFIASVNFNDFQLQLEDQNQANAETLCIIQLTDLTLSIEEIYSPMYIFTH